MVQGLGLAKKYLERINEITKLDDGSYNITYVNNVKINYAPKGIKKAVMLYIDENSEELIVPETKENNINTSNINSNIESNIVEKQEFQLILPEKYKNFFSEENLEILSTMVEERKIYAGTDSKDIILPEHYRTLKNDITISMKTNSEIYSEFKKYAAVNGLTVASLTNYIMDMFLKNIKSNK